MINYKVALRLFALCASVLVDASHSFFRPRQITTDPTFELALTDHYIYHVHDDQKKIQWDIKPFYQQSTQCHKTASYFLPTNKPCASVREDGTGDINPLWFNVISPSGSLYSSTISLSPKRTTFGGVMTVYVDLDLIVDGLWLLINTAAMGAYHSMHLFESNITGTHVQTVGTGTIAGFTDMCDGFNASNSCAHWCAGKIACCDNTRKKGGLDDIQVKLGYDFICPDKGHIAPYAVLTIPTGHRPDSKYLFEPLIGSKNVSLGAGLNLEYCIFQDASNATSILADCKYRYVFSSHETRSFDLTCTINGNWSRYLQVVSVNEPLNSMPGINYFTVPSKVIPRSTIDFWLAAHHTISSFDFEIGYTLWWRQKEKISLRCCKGGLSDNTIGIYDMTGVCSATPTTASTATIAQSILNNPIKSDSSFVSVSFNDLNISSAEHPKTLSNKVYAAFSGHCDQRFNVSYGLGGSYEIASTHNALNQWALWAMCGLDF